MIDASVLAGPDLPSGCSKSMEIPAARRGQIERLASQDEDDAVCRRDTLVNFAWSPDLE